MKKAINIKSFVLIGILGLSMIMSSCVKQEFAGPDAITPSFSVPSGATLLTIQQLKARHTIAGQLDSILDDVYVKGIVTGNDQYGNIYKTLYIQDSTGGLVLSLNKTSLCNEYKQGQLVYVKCKNLVLGDYGRTPQLGGVYNGGTGQLPEIFINDHLFKSGLPGSVPAPIHLRSASELIPDNLSKLVILDSCSFSQDGLPFVSDNVTTERSLKLKDGSVVAVRTSNYASFKNSIIPEGIGTVIGLLGMYNGAYQLVIRNIDDVFGFYVDPRIILNEKFSVTGSLGKFTQSSVVGSQVWAQSIYNGIPYAKMSGYVSPSSSIANEDWLISKSLDFSHHTNITMSFTSAMNYGVAGDGSLKVLYSINYNETGNPSDATWTEIPGFVISSGGFAWAGSGDVSLSSINASNVHIAFKYTCGTSSVPTWEITDVLLKGDPITK